MGRDELVLDEKNQCLTKRCTKDLKRMVELRSDHSKIHTFHCLTSSHFYHLNLTNLFFMKFLLERVFFLIKCHLVWYFVVMTLTRGISVQILHVRIKVHLKVSTSVTHLCGFITCSRWIGENGEGAHMRRSVSGGSWQQCSLWKKYMYKLLLFVSNKNNWRTAPSPTSNWFFLPSALTWTTRGFLSGRPLPIFRCFENISDWRQNKA